MKTRNFVLAGLVNMILNSIVLTIPAWGNEIATLVAGIILAVSILFAVGTIIIYASFNKNIDIWSPIKGKCINGLLWVIPEIVIYLGLWNNPKSVWLIAAAVLVSIAYMAIDTIMTVRSYKRSCKELEELDPVWKEA